MSIEPFTINVPEEALDQLRERLQSIAFPPWSPLLDDWKYGTPISTIQRLIKYWCTDYAWRATESRLNKLPQFMATVAVAGFGNVALHFVHARSKDPQSVPLLFCHGCEFCQS